MSQSYSNINSTSKENDKACDLGILNDRYIIKESLGSGGFGAVHIVFDILTKILLAVKIISEDKKDDSSFEKEEKIMKKVNESNINSCIKYNSSGVGFLTKGGKTSQRKYIIMELAEKDNLFDKLKKTKNGFSEDVCKYILYKIIRCIKDLHKIGICHRDIKPHNMVLVGKEYDLKLCDFGFAASFINENNEKVFLNERVGSLPYIAPEIIRSKSYDGEKVDVFSIGVTLFNLMTKIIPFQEFRNFSELRASLYYIIATKQIKEYWEYIESRDEMKEKALSKDFKKLFIKLVECNPNNRISLDEIMDSEWMKDIKNANEEYLEALRKKMINEMQV